MPDKKQANVIAIFLLVTFAFWFSVGTIYAIVKLF